MVDTPSSAARIFWFGAFELDRRSGELRKNGLRVGLQDQPLQVLSMLLERLGELVTREELRERLWPANTFVDFEHGLNVAVKRLRDVLGDSAEAPRFVETVPRRGYRFVAAVSSSGSLEDTVGKRRRPRASLVVTGLVTALIAVLAVGAWVSSRRRPGIATSPPRIRSLAVLPFKNLTGDPGQEYFADGMTDALSATLSQLAELTVISSTSAKQYKNSNQPAPQIAQDLGVDALLEGAVLQSGNRARVSAALIHGGTDRRLWAKTYDRDLADVLALYAEIAQTAAHEMSLVLTDSQLGRLANSGTVNTQAYDEYLRGTYLMNRWMAGGCVKAESHLLRSIELDAKFANPHAELVWCYVFPDRMQRPVAELAPKARASTARAMELNPTLASAHVGLGLIRYRIDYDRNGAEQAFRRALDLDPGSVRAHAAYGELLYMGGRPDDGYAMFRRAVQLDPFSPDRNVGLAYCLKSLRRYDEAIEWLRSALELDPAYATAHYWLAQTLDLKGDHDGALSAYLVWLDEVVVPQRASRARADLESAYARSGWRGFWRRELELADEEAAHPGTIWKPPYTRYAGAFYMAQRHARLGETNAALAFLEKAYEARHHLMVSLNVDPIFDGMRTDPRFRQLVRRTGLSPS